MTDIKFIRLKDIAEEISGMPVDITITTMLEDTDKYGAVGIDRTSGKVSILVDASAKSDEAIISVLAHELAHVLTNTGHGPDFEKKRHEILDTFLEKYWR
jgi:predicted metal-dependent hydrolase